MSKFLADQVMNRTRSTLLIEPMGLMSAEEPNGEGLARQRTLTVTRTMYQAGRLGGIQSYFVRSEYRRQHDAHLSREGLLTSP